MSAYFENSSPPLRIVARVRLGAPRRERYVFMGDAGEIGLSIKVVTLRADLQSDSEGFR